MSLQKSLIYLTVILLCLLLVSSCASPEDDPYNPTPIVVRLLDLNLAAEVTPSAQISTSTPIIITKEIYFCPTQIPAIQKPSVTVETTPTPPACTNLAEFLKNLSINDNTVLEPGQNFVKIWRIKNVGTCTWTDDYSLFLASGETMGGSLSVPFSQEVKPGETADLRLDLIAPFYDQTYTGNWMLQDAGGIHFGVGKNFDLPLSVIIVVKTPLPTAHT